MMRVCFMGPLLRLPGARPLPRMLETRPRDEGLCRGGRSEVLAEEREQPGPGIHASPCVRLGRGFSLLPCAVPEYKHDEPAPATKGGLLMTRRSSIVLTFVAAATIAMATPRVEAQVISNHLVCTKVKDPAPRASYTAHIVPSRMNDLVPCIIKVPAKMECQVTAKLNVNPPPPGGGPTTDIVSETGILRFLCYNTKCPRPEGADDVRTDQFGSRVLTLGPARLLCAPASPSGAFLDGSE